MAYHLGRDREARLQLEKVSTELQLLAVDEMDLVEIVSMGYTMAEARTGLRASLGDRKLAVEHIMRRRDEKAEIVRYAIIRFLSLRVLRNDFKGRRRRSERGPSFVTSWADVLMVTGSMSVTTRL